MPEEFSLASASAADFAPLIESEFTVVPEEEGAFDLRLTLAAVRELGQAPPGGGRAPFALDLTGPSEMPLPQATYILRHPTLGEFPLFLVPVGASPDGREYEAVFN